MSVEMVDVVDEEDNVTGKATKKEATHKKLLHRSTTIIVFDERGRLFVQKRAKTKDLWPGMLAIGVGETVQSGESYEEAAVRGMKEEIGITAKPEFLFSIRFRSSESNENCNVYKCAINEKPVFVDKEVEEGFFVQDDELKNCMEGFEPVSKAVIKRYWEMKNA